METHTTRCRNVLVIGDGASQPHQVLVDLLDGFLDARGSEVAEAPVLRRRSSTQSRTPSSRGSSSSGSHTSKSTATNTTQRSVIVSTPDGFPIRFNLTAMTHHGRSQSSYSVSSTSQRLAVPHSDVVMVTFSVHSRESFECAHRIMARAAKRNTAQLAGNKNHHTQFLLVGHHVKSQEDEDVISVDWDQEESGWAPSLWQQRDIHEEEAKQLAMDQRNCTYHEVCSDSTCTLQDCNTTAAGVCDDLIAATSTISSRRKSVKDIALKRWLKGSLKPKCLAGAEDDDNDDGISVSSDQLGSMKWWDESSEGTCSQWSNVVDAEGTSLCGSSPSSPSSPLQEETAVSPPNHTISSPLSPAHCSIFVESF